MILHSVGHTEYTELFEGHRFCCKLAKFEILIVAKSSGLQNTNPSTFPHIQYIVMMYEKFE